jgi:DNA (cytosine-5)-methyltransferase 1
LFAKAGGCSVGFARAAEKLGLEPYVVGIDKDWQKRYPSSDLVSVEHTGTPNTTYRFLQGDVLELLNTAWGRRFIRTFDFVHASPPCQFYSIARSIGNGADHPELIEPTRDGLLAAGVPYSIENVEKAKWALRDPVMLCGSMFNRDIKRHRLFETSLPIEQPDCHHDRWVNRYVIQRSRGRAEKHAVRSRVVSVFGRQTGTKRVGFDLATIVNAKGIPRTVPVEGASTVSVFGNAGDTYGPISVEEIEQHRFYEAPVVHVHGTSGGKGGVDLWREVMGIEWMVANEIREAIPPDYTEWLGMRLFPQIVKS